MLGQWIVGAHERGGNADATSHSSQPSLRSCSSQALPRRNKSANTFSNRPLSLTPQFFANTPLDLLFRPGVTAEMFNRFKLGRSLDEVHAYGCDLLFSACRAMGINLNA